VNFLVDAQLPRSLVQWFKTTGCEAIHTLDLKQGNRTPDKAIAQIADKRRAIIVTKDADFLDTHLLEGSPAKLLILSTGNISNRKLLELFAANMETILESLEQSNLVELNQAGLILHDS